MKVAVLFIMIFLHLLADYNFQGILADLKQKEWWRKNAPQPLYKKDYKVALLTHGFMWSFIMLLPLLIMAQTPVQWFALVLLYIVNTLLHAGIDDLKANEHCINLMEDQILHLVQVVGSWLVFCVAF